VKTLHFKRDAAVGFDMTPLIDVVSLLIIFFMLVFQFCAAELFEVRLPDRIVSAEKFDPRAGALMTITVMQKDGKVCYAAGADILPGNEPELLEKMIASAIDSRTTKTGQGKIVCLRCDKQIAFENVRPVLAGIARSGAEKVQWATVKN
jgi:biopolymer transport protein ExbD